MEVPGKCHKKNTHKKKKKVQKLFEHLWVSNLNLSIYVRATAPHTKHFWYLNFFFFFMTYTIDFFIEVYTNYFLWQFRASRHNTAPYIGYYNYFWKLNTIKAEFTMSLRIFVLKIWKLHFLFSCLFLVSTE